MFRTSSIRYAVGTACLITAVVVAMACSNDDNGNGGDAAATPTVEAVASPTPGAGEGGGQAPVPGTGGTPSGAPSFPTEADPPATTATANGETVEAAIGTYCWTLLCVDKIGVPTKGTLAVSSGDTVSIAIPEGVPPFRGASAAVFAAVDAQPLDDGSEIWPYPGAPGDEVTSTLTEEAVEVVTNLEPGQWVLSVFMTFEGGDVVYGVLLDVQ